MKTAILAISALVLSAGSALAHTGVTAHAHPHGDWYYALAAIIVLASVAAFAIYKKR